MKSLFSKSLALLLTLVFVLGNISACAEDAIQTILNTKTTQAFTQDPVSEDDLNAILQAGTSASSAINQQPWYFAVITSQEVMDEITGAPAGMPAGKMPEGFTPPEGMSMPEGAPAMPGGNMSQGVPAVGSGSAKAALGDSPVAIIIYMNENTSSPNASFDCGLACQNMVIAANALGYGTKIISSPTMALNGENHDALCEKLGVDTSLNAVAVLLIGTADNSVDGATGATTRNTIEEKVSFVK